MINKVDTQTKEVKQVIVEKVIEPIAQGSKQIEVNPVKDTEKTVQVDFMGSDYAQAFSSKTTKDSPEAVKPYATHPDALASDVRKEIAQFEVDKGAKLTFKDFTKMSEFLINLFDIGISTFFNWWSKDSARGAYSLSVPDKRILSEQLAYILVKYQAKFSIEFTFLLAIIVMYSAPAMAANKRRKELTTSAVKSKEKVIERAEEKKTIENNNNNALPTGFRKVVDGEIIPAGNYITQFNYNGLGFNITNAPVFVQKKDDTFLEEIKSAKADLSVKRPPLTRKRGGVQKA